MSLKQIRRSLISCASAACCCSARITSIVIHTAGAVKTRSFFALRHSGLFRWTGRAQVSRLRKTKTDATFRTSPTTLPTERIPTAPAYGRWRCAKLMSAFVGFPPGPRSHAQHVEGPARLVRPSAEGLGRPDPGVLLTVVSGEACVRRGGPPRPGYF